MSNPKKKKTNVKALKPVSERYTLTNMICNFFLIVVFTLFPLFVNTTFTENFPFVSFSDGYIAIRHQKYYFFLVITGMAVIAEILLLLTRSSQSAKEADPKKQSLYKSLSFTDWAVLAFVFSCAVSTVFSPYIDMAVNGEITIGDATYGRNNGLILMLFYAAVYFLVTRCFKFKEYVFVAMAGVSGFIYLLAVLNGFYIDPLDMFSKFVNEKKIYNNFMTTIGNKNMFSSYICVTLPLVVSMFVYTKKLWRRFLYLGVTVLGAMAVVICDSDSVVLGIGAFALVFIVAYSRCPVKLRKLMLALTVMLISVKLLWLITLINGNDYKELSAIPFKLMTSNAAFIAIGVMAVITAALYYATLTGKVTRFPKAVPIVLTVLFGLAVLFGLGVIIYFTAFDTKTKLGELERTLRYSDRWGTHRGFMWNKAIEAFGGFNFFQKLFGTGPDTFFYTFSPYFGELYNRFGDGSTDAAHNEYINYLLNLGIVGLTSYLAFTGSALVRAFKAAKKNPLVLVFTSAVVAYMAQAVVNIALPIATPLFVICVALCEAIARNPRKQTDTKEEESANSQNHDRRGNKQNQKLNAV